MSENRQLAVAWAVAAALMSLALLTARAEKAVGSSPAESVTAAHNDFLQRLGTAVEPMD